MKMNAKQAQKAIDTPEMHDLVKAYLMQRAFTEVLREQVDAIWQSLLNENQVYEKDQPGKRITEPRYTWLTDDETFARLAAEANQRERAAGIKPADMSDDFCPALVAETELSNIKRAIIDTSGKPLGVSADRLLCAGMDKYNKWLDLVVGAIVNSPKFEAPTLC